MVLLAVLLVVDSCPASGPFAAAVVVKTVQVQRPRALGPFVVRNCLCSCESPWRSSVVADGLGEVVLGGDQMIPSTAVKIALVAAAAPGQIVRIAGSEPYTLSQCSARKQLVLGYTYRMAFIFYLAVVRSDHAVVRTNELIHILVVVDRQDSLAQTARADLAIGAFDWADNQTIAKEQLLIESS
jgi:hypothetical protein